MGLFGNLFGKKKDDEPKEFNLCDNVFVNEKGEVYGEFEIKTSFNGQEFVHKLPINTTAEKLEEDYFRKKANKANPNSCEREPNENEIKIPVSDIDKYQKSLPLEHDLRNKLFRAELKIINNSCNNIILSKKEYEELESRLQQHNDSITLQNKVYRLLDKGKELEKAGNIDLAIKVYQEVVAIGYNGVGYGINKPYDRLMILYRKNKDVDNEIKIIEQAIYVLLEDNSKRAFSAIEKHPDKKDQILNALPTCNRVMGDDGFYCFIPYDVIKYRDRLLKIKK